MKIQGKGLSITFEKCKTNITKDSVSIKRLIDRVVEIIKMNKLGNLKIEVGSPHLPGFSAVQIIETSHIALHCFSNDISYLFNIESCKDFDEEPLISHLLNYFQPSNYKINCLYTIGD